MSHPLHECGVVLHPAGHTRSPAMHTAAFALLGIPARYRAFDVPSHKLQTAMAKFRRDEIRQLAVSIPHKETIMSLVDEVDDVARAIGAVNTITRAGDRLVATNTDWIGALGALERVTEVRGQRAVVLGAGGTARALVYALRQRDCEVFVLNRTRAKAEGLARELGAAGAGDLQELARLAPNLLVNTTSVGLGTDDSPVPAAALSEKMTVLDAVYSPARTRLLREAEAAGARTVGGKWMLVHQAAEQLRIWTAQLATPPSTARLLEVPAVMAEAFDAAGEHG